MGRHHEEVAGADVVERCAELRWKAGMKCGKRYYKTKPTCHKTLVIREMWSVPEVLLHRKTLQLEMGWPFRDRGIMSGRLFRERGHGKGSPVE